jgi:hypothetical protein
LLEAAAPTAYYSGLHARFAAAEAVLIGTHDVTLANLDPNMSDLATLPAPSPVHTSAELALRADDIAPEPDEPRKRRLYERLEAFISRLSTRNNFWHRVCSLIWLPYAFRSGITMKRLDNRRFRAVLPFKRVNRNWYNAMAGAALLGNSEVAGGMFLFSEVGGEYIIVCKEMKYRFLRPCLGPAVYEVVNAEDVKDKVDAGGEFNINLEMEIRQQLRKKGRELRVGRCDITFHCTPKAMLTEKMERRKELAKAARD